MKKILILGILFIYFGNTYGQVERRIPFSVAVAAHIEKYNIKSNEAYKDQDLEYAQFLFDSLVTNHLRGTYMNNFKMSPLKKGELVTFQLIEKPIFLITSAAWCVPGVGEIPALNDLADKFHDQIDFVVLFWDTRENLREKSYEYSENIQLLYINEKENHDTFIINNLKHSLGFPMMFFMDSENKILNIQKVAAHHSSETISNSYNIHFNSLSKGVSLLIADLEAKGQLAPNMAGDDDDFFGDGSIGSPQTSNDDDFFGDGSSQTENDDYFGDNDNDEKEVKKKKKRKKRKRKRKSEDDTEEYPEEKDTRTDEEKAIDAEYERYLKEKDNDGD